MVAVNKNLEAFSARAFALLTDHFNGVGAARRGKLWEVDVIDVPVKTCRADSGWGECDGTEPPTRTAMEAAAALAKEFGLLVKWEPCEKGHGDLYFEADPAAAHLRHVPLSLRAAYQECLENLANKTCRRCDGLGHLDEQPNWILIQRTGRKTCFRCKGTGEEPKRKYADPLIVRRAVASRLLSLVQHRKVEMIEAERERARLDPLFPILADVFERALTAAKSR